MAAPEQQPRNDGATFWTDPEGFFSQIEQGVALRIEALQSARCAMRTQEGFDSHTEVQQSKIAVTRTRN